MSKSKKIRSWHKWIGLPISIFAILFAISGIVLNHRDVVSNIDISREWLPKYLHIKNWNQSSVKTTLYIGTDSLLMYGAGGIWLTDTRHSFAQKLEEGMKVGADNRNVAKIIKTSTDDIFAVTTFDLYYLDKVAERWVNLSNRIETNERLTDIATDSNMLVVMSRSEIFRSTYPFETFEKSQILPPADYDGKVSLFRTIWMIHSGEIFGVGGKLFVDLLGIVVIILSLTGIIIFLFPKIVKGLKSRNKDVTLYIKTLRPSYLWHNKLGYWLFAFIFILFLSGTFLRPPLLIAIARSKVSALPFSTLDSKNGWNDRLRCLNYDTLNNEWILYSSEGFYSLKSLDSVPTKIQNTPRVSVMGVNVMKQVYRNCWIIGSFDGLVLWDRESETCIDYITKQPIIPRRAGPPIESSAITGYSNDFIAGDIAFGYSSGARYIHSNKRFMDMPQAQMPQKISLWHLGLEVHTGRIFKPLIGFFSDLYIFISGVLLIIVAITGLLIYKSY